jgi:ferric-dicitrate binding protein FerR (iron transport regulator)
MEPQKIEELIIRYLCGDATQSEVEEVNQLCKTDDAFRKEFGEMQFAWVHSAMPRFDAEQDWKLIRKRIAYQSERQSPFAIFARAAAVITLVLSVSTGLWFYWNVPGYGRWVVFETEMKSDSIILPDASIVYLNRNSSLKYKSAFMGTDREVALKGEGYFEVKHDKTRPFKVEIGPVSVDVLGTSFHLNGTRKDGIVELNVTQGSVAYSNSRERISVKEGEWAIAGVKVMGKGYITNPNFISWKTGLLEFNNASLNEVAIALNNHFVEIEKIKIVGASDVFVTTRFKGQTLAEINEELSLHFQKKFQLYQGTLTISD